MSFLTISISYEGEAISIQSREDEEMEDVLRKYYAKTSREYNSLTFVYNGAQIKGKKLVKDFLNKMDKERKKMNILAIDNIEANEKKVEEEENDNIIVNFSYKKKKTIIQSNPKEKMKKIFEQFTTKSLSDINKLNFWYMGRIIFDKIEIDQYLNFDGQKRKEMNILVTEKKDKYSESIIKSKQIICPICGEFAKFNVKNYKMSIYGCKYNHKLNDMNLEEFQNSQLIDISKIICDKCKDKNKYNTFRNEFHHCFSCNMNLCPLCKSNHDKKHNIINYDNINYYCSKHCEKYSYYCKKCKKSVCDECDCVDDNHDIISLGKMIIKKDDLEKNIKKYKDGIDKINNNISEIINKLKKISDNLDKYYKIYSDFMNNYDVKNRNYYILHNAKEIQNNNDNMAEINEIIEETNYTNKVNEIFKLYNSFYDDKIEIGDNIISNSKTNESNNEKDIIIEEQKTKIEELTNQIDNLKESNKGNYGKDRLIELLEEITKKDKEIKELKESQLNSPYTLKPGEKLFPLIFVSEDQVIHYAIICKNTDKFKDIEDLLYSEYPEYGESENYFLVKGKKVNRFKTLKDNGLKNSDVVTLYPIEL